MPKATNTRNPEWTLAETNALILLYQAGWRWPAISAHVSGIYGNQRSYSACQCRGGYLGILDTSRKGRPRDDRYDEDILDLMLLDYSTFEIRDALNCQYKLRLSQCFVYRRMRAHRPQYIGWKLRLRKRRARYNLKGWETRRAAA